MANIAYGYGRVSSYGQKESGVGEESQAARNKATFERFLLHDGFTWGGQFFDGGVSADRVFFSRRPQAEMLLRALTPGDALVVFDVVRLARVTRDALSVYELLKKMQVRLIVGDMMIDTKNPMVVAMFGMMAVFAELDTSFIKLRNRGRVAAMRAGGWTHGGVPPYGYLMLRGERHTRLAPDLVDRTRSRMMAYWRSPDGGRYSCAEIARHLNAQGQRMTHRRQTRDEKARGRKAEGLWTEVSARDIIMKESRLSALEAEAGVDNVTVFLIPHKGAVAFDDLSPLVRRCISDQLAALAKSARPAPLAIASGAAGR